MANIPNTVTLVRFLLVPSFIMSVFCKDFKLALLLFLVASISDALDGFLARRLNQITTMGIITDPLADKTLIDSGFILLSFVDKVIPLWLAILVISRDVLIIIGSWILINFGKMGRISPLFIGKITAFSQFFTIFIALLKFEYPICSVLCIKIVYVLTASLTVFSTINYSVWWVRELDSDNSKKVSG